MNRTQIDAFAALAAADRKESFGASITFRSVTFNACISSQVIGKELLDSGYRPIESVQIRIRTSDVTSIPLLEEVITVVATGKSYRINQVVPHSVNPEWVVQARKVM